MLKQILSEVINKNVIANGGEKVVRPWCYLPTSGLHQGQVIQFYICAPRLDFVLQSFFLCLCKSEMLELLPLVISMYKLNAVC